MLATRPTLACKSAQRRPPLASEPKSAVGSRIPNRLIEERLRAEVGRHCQAGRRCGSRSPIRRLTRVGDELARLPAHLPRDPGERRDVRASASSCPTTRPAARRSDAPVTYESLRRLDEFPDHRALGRLRARARGMIELLELAGHPAAARGARRPPPVHPRGRAAHVLQPAAARAFCRRDHHGRGRSASSPTCSRPSRARRRERRARSARRACRTCSCPRITARSLPSVAQCDDELLPAWAPIRTPHTELSQHVPHRDRARLLARLHLLRDAPLDQRRHAHRAQGADPRAHPRRRASGSAWSARR